MVRRLKAHLASQSLYVYVFRYRAIFPAMVIDLLYHVPDKLTLFQALVKEHCLLASEGLG